MIIADLLILAAWAFVTYNLIRSLTVITIQLCVDRPQNKFARFINMFYLQVQAWFKNGQVVALLDYKDNVTYSIALPGHDETIKNSYINWQLEIGPIWLHEDGSVTRPHGEYTYIVNWLPLQVENRTFMILQGARGFDV